MPVGINLYRSIVDFGYGLYLHVIAKLFVPPLPTYVFGEVFGDELRVVIPLPLLCQPKDGNDRSGSSRIKGRDAPHTM